VQHDSVPVSRYYLLTRLGLLELGWTPRGLHCLRWCRRLPASAFACPTPFPAWLDRTVAMLRLYCEGRVVHFRRVPIDWSGFRPFQRLVLKACRSIPFGKTVSYQELAQQIGRPRAVRAVARALATNPLPIVIPCHRVVRKNGNLGGYSAPGGVALKRRLLQMEKQALLASAQIADINPVSHVRLAVADR
jgi:methylated-DNA-[protein]-cysteine S-methyltransferase